MSTFKLIKKTMLENLNVEVQQYEHIKTGAQHVHFASENTENAFMVTLRTMPEDSTGVAHILEHTALCGSKNYPVRDPFFSMMKRSLNSFMNAFTSSDWTSYPFATANKKDYDNLLGVYLDSVFFPSLEKLAFNQEGHRVEFTEKGDKSSDLEFKGVVFNEMKGAMDETRYVYGRLFSELFPHNTYFVNSGGEPENIPDLTYDEFVAFHKKHYHPSNAIFLTFGNISAEENQERFEKLVLKDFDKLDVHLTVESEKPFSEEKNVTMTHVCDEEDLSNRTYIQKAWCLGEATDAYHALKVELLEMLLLSDSSAPLRSALETADFAKAPNFCGMSDEQKQIVFMAGVQGTEAENKDKFATLLDSVFEKVMTEGVAPERVTALLDQLEYGSRNLESGSYPFGLNLILRGVNQVTHHANIIDALNVEPLIERLRTESQDPEFVKNLVKELLVDNKHAVTVVSTPDADLRGARVEKEKARLAQMKSEMSDADMDEVIKQADALEAYQNEEEDLSILPKVTRKDVGDDYSFAKSTTEEISGLKVTKYTAPTNGIIAERVVFEMPKLTAEEIQLLPAYAGYLTSLGVADKSYAEMAEIQTSVCRSFHMSEQITSMPNDANELQGYLNFSARFLARKQDDANALIVDTLNNVRFDELQRMREILVQRTEGVEKSLERNGHVVAAELAFSSLTKVSHLGQLRGGIQAVATAKDLVKKTEDEAELKAFADKLAAIHEKVKVSPRRLVVVADAALMTETANGFAKSMSGLTAVADTSKVEAEFKPASVKQIWAINTSVNYCSKAYKAVGYMHKDAAVLSVLAPYMSQAFLHREVREKGGAYGGGAMYRPNAGFGFYSYRDPRVEGTLEDFDKSIDWMLTAEHKEQDLESAILTVISRIDKPQTPISDALATFGEELTGYSEATVKQRRNEILNVTIADLKRVTETYLKDKPHNVAVLANLASATENSEKLGLEMIKL